MSRKVRNVAELSPRGDLSEAPFEFTKMVADDGECREFIISRELAVDIVRDFEYLFRMLAIYQYKAEGL